MAIELEVLDFSEWADQLEKRSIPELKQTLRAAHAITALSELKFEQARGNLLQPVQFVDNLPRKKLKNVKFAGRIEYKDQGQFGDEDSTQLVNIIREVMGYLRAHSPVGNEPHSPSYITSHVVWYNGVGVSSAATRPLNPGDSLIFTNYMPYAKRLEGQAQPVKAKKGKALRKDIRNTNAAIRARRAFGPTDEEFRTPTPFEKEVLATHGKYTPSSKDRMSTQAPNGIYAAVHKKLARKYRGLLSVGFKYLPFSQFVGDPYNQNRTGGGWKTIRSNYMFGRQGPVVFPVITIELANNTISPGRLN